MKYTYRIDGMHCAACIEKIKAALSPHIKISAITLNPPQLQIEAPSSPSLEALNKHIATAGTRYHLHPIDQALPVSLTQKSVLQVYFPIFLIAAYIIGVATINNFSLFEFNWQHWMNQFMAGFFLVFSGFKLLDLKGFADGYASYDLLARYVYPYGFVYPFLELGLGILYLGFWFPAFTLWLTVIIMGFSSLGVINTLLKKQQIQCACLGTVLNVPLSSITLIEDLLMVVLALVGLYMQ